jgi:hypothetical protein
VEVEVYETLGIDADVVCVVVLVTTVIVDGVEEEGVTGEVVGSGFGTFSELGYIGIVVFAELLLLLLLSSLTKLD